MNYVSKYLGCIVIPKTEKIERLKENYNFQNFNLDNEDIDKIKKLD